MWNNVCQQAAWALSVTLPKCTCKQIYVFLCMESHLLTDNEGGSKQVAALMFEKEELNHQGTLRWLCDVWKQKNLPFS